MSTPSSATNALPQPQIPAEIQDAAKFVRDAGDPIGADQLVNSWIKENGGASPTQQQPVTQPNQPQQQAPTPPASPAAPAPPAPAPAPAATPPAPAASAPAGNAAPDADDDDPGSDINQFLPTPNQNAGKAGAMVFNNMQDFTAALQRDFGIADPATAMTAFKKTRAQVQKLMPVAKAYEDLQTALKSLPGPVLDLIEDYHQGGDWQARVTELQNLVDYTKPFEKQDVVKVMSVLNPTLNFTDYAKDGYIDLKDSKDPTVHGLILNTKELYKQKANEQSARIQQNEARWNQQLETEKTAIAQSIDNLVDQLPQKKLHHTRRKAVEQFMASSKGNPYIYNDGKFTDNAAQIAYYAVFGPEIVPAMQKALQASNGTVDAIVNRGGEQPRPFNSQSTPAQPKLPDHVESMVKANGGGSIYDMDTNKLREQVDRNRQRTL
jgi:hypothetical protein